MTTRPLPEKIAIVGMGCIFPDANTPDEFWRNIVEKKISIRKVSDDPPAQRVFDVEAHYDPTVYGRTDKGNKSYTDVSALVRDFAFDPRRYRIPPTVADHMDENQKIALTAADQALAGVALDGIDRAKISVFIGCSMIGETHHAFQKQIDFERFAYHLQNHPAFQEAMGAERREALLRELLARTTPRPMAVTEDSAPGVLPNLVAARIASVFDFHGHAYLVDAACASGLASVICGVQHLVSGESDAVVCGAADMLIGEVGRIYFSGINALSPDGSYPFDERANGFVIGQGGGILVLKRLSDAVRDGDAIHAVIAGYGQSSDGKGKAIAAPNPVWQAKTIQRAHEMAGFAPDTVELIEAHGTATKVGDASEISALKTSFGNLGATGTGTCAVGSVKSNIGHLKSAAGIASLVKTIQALRHKTLPPTANCLKVDPKLGIEGSPFFVNTEAKPWEAKSHPRRAGVSAFGFGGANYHIALEEFRPQDVHAAAKIAATSTERDASRTDNSRIVLLSGRDDAEIAGRGQALLARIEREPARLGELVLEESYRAEATHPRRLAVVFDTPAALATRIELWKTTPAPEARKLLRAKGIFAGEGRGKELSQTAFLFSGQGSQYADMLLELVRRHPSVQRTTSRIDAWWSARNGEGVSSLVSSRTRGKEATEALLKNTRHTHPALLWGNLAVATLLQDMGVRPAWMIGHSAGEVVALAAAGKLSLSDALRTMDERSRAFVEMATDDFGKMVAVRTDRVQVEALIAKSGQPVEIANLNAPDQIIASGPSEAIVAFCGLLKTENVKHVELNVSHAFHSAVVAPAARRFGAAIQDLTFSVGHADVLVNETRTAYPESAPECRAILESQVTAPVDFCGGIEELYRRGVRLFVEVGPGSVLGNLAQAILKDRDVAVVSCNHRNADELESLNKALGTLFAEGIALDLIPATETDSVQAVPVVAAAPAPTTVASETRDVSIPQQTAKTRVVYSGVAVGLPGSFRKSFQDDNFEQLFAGRNFIERLTDPEKAKLVDLRVTRVEKTANGPSFHVLDTMEEVIQLAGRLGKIDALADYALDPKESAQMNQAILHGVAAGYEALRDARIPLVRQYARTAGGSLLPDRWVLPAALQKRTGVIFAHSFPMVETVIQEVARHLHDKLGSRLGAEILEFYQSLVQQVRDPQAKKLLTDWFVLHRNRLSPSAGSDEVYTFNHQFINQISMLANNRLANFVNALGPNFQINAACSSTCTAVTLAEEMIRSGRADRFLVIAADDATSPASLPYLGAGFLSSGAATTEADLYKAALPFDLRRNGMVMSAGAVGIVVESAPALAERGIAPVCELLGTHVFNTAGHHARLDIPRYAEELDEFLARMEGEHALSRQALAPRLLYFSHETYTPARGGCSEAEAVALRHAFGEASGQIEVTNTKGMTGHTMGTSIEDVAAARALQTGLVPPVVNHQVTDPALAGLKLSKGGRHDRRYALRMAAGFGSQGNYILLGKVDAPADRMTDSVKHRRWLAEVSGQASPELETMGRVLRVKDKQPGAVVARRPQVDCAAPASSSSVEPVESASSTARRSSGTANPAMASKAPPTAPPDASSIQARVLKVVSEITGYPPEMIELDMEIEADLGVDTVKQATILALLGEQFGMDAGAGFQISAYPTIGHLVRLFAGSATAAESATPPTDFVASRPAGSAPAPAPAANAKAVQEQVLAVVSEITGYPPEMLEPDMEIEADLGVDTVKQATILALLGERYGMDAGAGFQISAYPTIGHLVRLFAGSTDSAGIGSRTDLVEHEDSPSAPPAAATAQREGSDNPDLPGQISRQTLERVAQPFEGPKSALASKSILVIADEASIALELARRLSEVARRVAILAIPRDGNPDHAVRTLQERADDPADIWIDLGAMGSDVELSDLDDEAMHHAVSRMAECRYALCKSVESSGTGKPGQILYVGRSSSDPVTGFLTGFFLSLAKEWNIPSRVLEAEGIDALAPLVVAELAHASDAARVVYRDGVRHAWKVVDAGPPTRTPLEFDVSDTILVTGGANGIAAQVVLGLAARYPAKFILVGRTPLEAIDFADPRWDDVHLDARKEEWREKLAHTGLRMTPALLEREFARVLKQREIARTLAQIRALGRSVHYLSADVTDLSGLRAGLESIRSTTGNITAVVHAAGMDLSRPLARKTVEEFSMVQRIKTVGALNLARLVPPSSLRLFCAFTSISGVFGNAAQMDYSSANAFLDAFVQNLSNRNPDLRAMSLAWSGWRDVGMAWRNDFVRAHAESMGLGLIPPRSGVSAAIRELTTSTGGTVILHRGLGGMLDARWASSTVAPSPLIDRVETSPDGTERAYHVFSVEGDEFLNQHRLNGTPLMPGVGFLEFMAEFHARLEPSSGAFRFRNLSFHDAFKLHRDQAREAWIEARPTGAPGEWSMRIHSEFKSRVGDLVEVRDYSAADVSSGIFAAPDPARRPTLENPERIAYGQILSHLDKIPQNVVFGPLFHDSRRPDATGPDIEVEWNRTGLRTPYRFPRAHVENPRYPLDRFVLNPCLLDSLHQAGVIHTILRTGLVHLPYGAAEFVVAGKQDRTGTYQVEVNLVEENPDVLVYDIVLSDEQGKACAWIHRSSYHRIAS